MVCQIRIPSRCRRCRRAIFSCRIPLPCVSTKSAFSRTRRTRCLPRTTRRSATPGSEADALGVDAWLTEDHTHVVKIASPPIAQQTSRFRRGRVPNGTAAARFTADAGACNQSDSRREAPLRKPWNRRSSGTPSAALRRAMCVSRMRIGVSTLSRRTQTQRPVDTLRLYIQAR
jgi:hypothetical protein